jgi:putative sterol carrier protein
VDQVIFVQQAGTNRHEHICESLELFGEQVLPHFTDAREEREAAKRERLSAAVERALARRSPPRPADRGYVVTPGGEPRPARVIAAAHRAASNGAPARRHPVRDRLRRTGESAFAAFVRGRSDAQLERTVGSKAGLRMIFKGMEHAFVPGRANGFSGEFQYELTGPNGDQAWFVRIEDGNRAVAVPGRAAAPGVTFRTSVPTFARIASGEVHPAKAMLEGDLEVRGDFELAARLGEMFGQDSLL